MTDRTTTPPVDYTLRPLTETEATGYPVDAQNKFLDRLDRGLSFTSSTAEEDPDLTLNTVAYGANLDRLPAWATVSDATGNPDASVVGELAIQNGRVTSMAIPTVTEMYTAPHLRPFAELRTRITQPVAARFPRITVDRFTDGVGPSGSRTGVEHRALSLFPWEVYPFIDALKAAADLAMVSVPHPGAPGTSTEDPEANPEADQ